MTLPASERRPLDHLVLPVKTLAEARARLAALGFTVAPEARHPFGTENACVFLASGTYLEPLAVASLKECQAAVEQGNVFVARDQAFRLRHAEGLLAIVGQTADAGLDHARFVENGLSGGDMLAFERPVLQADGQTAQAGFRLAFSADPQSPDFFLFTCQRVRPLTVDRAALERHDNGALAITSVILTADDPASHLPWLRVVLGEGWAEARPYGVAFSTAAAQIEIVDAAGLQAMTGLPERPAAEGLSGAAVVFGVADLQVTERLLADKGVATIRRQSRLIVPHQAGQGALYLFQEVS
ncbi:VOC family protein [Rhizobium sp. CG5]|uniref:VOC family protein n=1 Tax=Rhizobium sp. CG5 TaxID=2726076 RepID=UPI0020346FED|nr:VOC family protein [Rhizobium sp. CG5]MCM2474822.1 VOC family protein [Rhizobium sp. CG5]